MEEKIRKWYHFGLWTHSMVLQAVEKGRLSPDQANAILKEEGDE